MAGEGEVEEDEGEGEDEADEAFGEDVEGEDGGEGEDGEEGGRGCCGGAIFVDFGSRPFANGCERMGHPVLWGLGSMLGWFERGVAAGSGCYRERSRAMRKRWTARVIQRAMRMSGMKKRV